MVVSGSRSQLSYVIKKRMILKTLCVSIKIRRYICGDLESTEPNIDKSGLGKTCIRSRNCLRLYLNLGNLMLRNHIIDQSLKYLL